MGPCEEVHGRSCCQRGFFPAGPAHHRARDVTGGRPASGCQPGGLPARRGPTTRSGLPARRRAHNQKWAASPKEGPQPEVGCQPGPVVLTAGARESCCSLLRDDCPATRSADGPVSRALPARRCTAKLRNASAPQRDMGLQATWGIIRSKWAQQALPAVPSPPMEELSGTYCELCNSWLGPGQPFAEHERSTGHWLVIHPC